MVTSNPSAPELSRGRLLAQIGAARARLSWQDASGAPLRAIAVYATDEVPTVLALVRRSLEEYTLPLPDAVCPGIAGPLEGDEICLPDSERSFSLRALGLARGTPLIWALDEIALLANATPTRSSGGCLQTEGGSADLSRPIGVVAVGERLGVAGLISGGS